MLYFKKGISTLEIIFILIIIVTLVLISVSAFKKVNRNSVLENTISQTVFVLDNAQSMTLSSKGDSQYGVHIGNDKLILFKGSSYNQSDPTNEEFILGDNILITGVTLNGGGVDVIFQKLTGETTNYGSFQIYQTFDPSNIKTINIEPTGIVKKN